MIYETGCLGIEPNEKIYKQEELGMAGVVDWSKPFSLGEFPVADQKQTYTCGAQMLWKILGAECKLRFGKWVDFSKRDIYTKRKNYPSAGMFAGDVFEIGAKGVTLEQLMPTTNITEYDFNYYSDRTEIDERLANELSESDFPYMEIVIDVDSIANHISTGHPVGLLVRWEYNEWDLPYPKVLSTKEPYGHFVCATGYKMENGIKYIVIEDSWGTNKGDGGKRYLSEEFIKAHCKSAIAYTKFELNESDKVRYTFTQDLTIGSQGEEVKQLQIVLQSLGFFPSGQEPTGKFYGITRSAVKKFQLKYGITPAEGYFGAKTREIINNI